MEPADIRAIARAQWQHGAALVEVQGPGGSVTIRIEPGTGACARASKAPPAGEQVVPRPVEDSSLQVVRSPSLGIARLAHPCWADSPLRKGLTLKRGQPVLYLQLGVQLACVEAPADGVVDEVLVADGDRVDYGKPLVRLASAREQ